MNLWTLTTVLSVSGLILKECLVILLQLYVILADNNMDIWTILLYNKNITYFQVVL